MHNLNFLQPRFWPVVQFAEQWAKKLAYNADNCYNAYNNYNARST